MSLWLEGPQRGRRKALLVISEEFRDHASEALAIADSADYDVVKVIYRSRPGRRISDAACEMIAKEAKETGAETIIYYGNLEPSSIYKLEKASRLRVLDRVLVILEIFARHAGSKEAKLQIEMAELKHMLPILREYVRRTKLGEQVDFLGPGRYAFESYVKFATHRIARIRRELDELRRRVVNDELKRKEAGLALVAIVGYASAGKTSLFNLLTSESKPVGPEYFTTLSAKHKAVTYDGLRLNFVDTVGFVRDVPPEIIEAFYSTLQEAALADAIVFVIDASEEAKVVREKVRAGLEILKRLGALQVPVIMALNKVDLVQAGGLEELVEVVRGVAGQYLGSAPVLTISALKGWGVGELLKEVAGLVRSRGAAATVQQGLRTQAGPQASKG